MDKKIYELKIEAEKDNFSEVLDFVDSILEELGCSMKIQMQINLAVEEIFVNIASYAYGSDTGEAEIRVEVLENPKAVKIIFMDRGVPYNPLEKEDPDITLSIEERGVGGLGIFMVKKSVDEMSYEYADEKNILTIMKRL